MGFIDKIRSLFIERKGDITEREKALVNIEKINSIIDEKGKTLNNIFKQKIEVLYNEIIELIDALNENKKALSEVDLSYRKEDERIKKITEIGREEFAIEVEKLIDKLKQKDKLEENPNYIIEQIEKFAISSAKSHFKATQLIGREVENITRNITKIRELSLEFNKENREILDANNKIIEIKNKNKKRILKGEENLKIKKETRDILNNIKNNDEDLKNIEKSINKIKLGNDFKERQELIKKRQLHEEALKSLEFQIKTLIDGKILEKYSYLILEKTTKKYIEEYLEDPIRKLVGDNELLISDILQDIIQKIKNNEITLKNSEKVIKKINMNKLFFQELKNKIADLNEQIFIINKDMEKIVINIDDLENEKERIESSKEQNAIALNAIKRKQLRLEEEIFNINEEIKKELLSIV